MIAVIFEVEPKEGARPEYIEIASALRSHLDDMPGFISIERFESLSAPGKILSLSFWESEEAVARWRALAPHRQAQHKGRGDLFADYRLRVAQVNRDYGMNSRTEAPPDSRSIHD